MKTRMEYKTWQFFYRKKHSCNRRSSREIWAVPNSSPVSSNKHQRATENLHNNLVQGHLHEKQTVLEYGGLDGSTSNTPLYTQPSTIKLCKQKHVERKLKTPPDCPIVHHIHIITLPLDRFTFIGYRKDLGTKINKNLPTLFFAFIK